MSLSAHYWTLVPSLRHRISPAPDPGARPWSVQVPDALFGSVRLSGLLREAPGAKRLLLIVHGMGGRPTSHYCVRAADAAHRLGLSTLRLALRGADRQGEDFYHAGLTLDLRAALESPEVRDAGYEAVYVLGYSLGGHVSLRLALEELGVPLAGVAAVCPPLDLVACAHALDNVVPWFYRQYVLGGLKTIYKEVARRRPVPSPAWEVMRVTTVRDWDRLAVVPRHGFASPDAYYEGESVAPRLKALEVPSIVVACEHDPMVPVETVRAAGRLASSALEVRTTASGGHVAFPRTLDLGMPGALGLEAQLMAWLVRNGRTSVAPLAATG